MLLGWLALLVAGCSGQPTASASLPESPAPSTAVAFLDGVPQACSIDEFGCAVIADGDPILIGTALTLTGPDAARGLDSQYGAQVALNLRGAVLGHEVELVNQDERCSADGGTAAAALLETVEGMVGVVGTSCSASAIPAAQLLGERGILLISPSNTDPSLTEDVGRYPFYARVAGSDETQATAMAEFACTELAVTTAATIQDGSAYAMRLESAFAGEFETRCGGTVMVRETISPTQKDFADVLASIANAGDERPPEILYFPVTPEQTVLIARQARRTEGMQEAFLAGIRIGLDGHDASSTISEAGPGVDGMYLSGAALTPGGDYYSSVFLEEYARVSAEPAPIGAFHADAYDAVNLLLDVVGAVAIRSDGTLYVPRRDLVEELHRVRGYQGLTGTLTCRPDGNCADPAISVWQVVDGEFQPAWP